MTYLKADTNTNIDNYLNNLIIHSFLPSILFPTRVTKNSSTLIDHIYYYQGCKRKNELKLFSGNLFSDLSDHLPSFIILSNIKSKRNLANRPLIRLYNDKNKKQFQDSLLLVNWQNTLYDNDNVNESYNSFVSIIKQLYENNFPLTRISRHAYEDKEWVTKGLKESSRQKEKLYRKWLLSKNCADEMY